MGHKRGWRFWSSESAMEAAIVVGLLALLALPIVTWRVAAARHARIEDVIVPIGDRADELLNKARTARSVAISHYMGLDEPSAIAYASAEEHFRSSVRAWEDAAAKPVQVADLGPASESAWTRGIYALRRWMTEYSADYFRDRSASNLARMKRGSDLFAEGIRDITSVRTAAEKRQEAVRETILRLNRFEAGIVAPLGVICLLIAAQAWRNLRQLRTSRERLEVVVRETNHRVKNNLQVVAALLEMELTESQDERARESLAGIMRQVQGMAAVHDLLSRQNAGDVVATDQLLRRVVELASQSAGLDVSVTSDPLPLQAKQATALALVANELVLNASKHGARRSRISLTNQNGCVDMRVEDDGPGFPAGFDVNRDSNLGLGLVTTLVRHDLHGQIQFPADGGNRVEITFPAPAPIAA